MKASKSVCVLLLIVPIFVLWCVGYGQVIGPDEVVIVPLAVYESGEAPQIAPVVDSGQVAFSSQCFGCIVHRVQYALLVPQGTLELVVELANLDDVSADLDLAVEWNSPVTEDADKLYTSYISAEAGGEERIVLPTAGEDGVAAGTYFAAVVSLVGEGDRFELRAYAVVEEGVAAVDLPATTHLFPPSAQPMPEGFVTHEDASLGFAVSYPRDWELLPPEAREEEDVLGYRLIAEDGSRRAMFKIGTWTLPAPQTTQEGYEESREAFSAVPGYEFVERRDLLMGGFPAIRHVFNQQYEMLARLEMTYWVRFGTDAWLVTFAVAPVEVYAEYESVLEAILASFRYIAITQP